MKYLFRGKAVDGGEWVEGSLIENSSECLIYPDNFGLRMRVIPATIGMFTGLCDKNGRRIFEGDILERRTTPATSCRGALEFDALFACWIWRELHLYQVNHTVSVVGTVHDEPEGVA